MRSCIFHAAGDYADDLNGPGEAILMDDDAPKAEKLNPAPDLKSKPKSR